MEEKSFVFAKEEKYYHLRKIHQKTLKKYLKKFKIFFPIPFALQHTLLSQFKQFFAQLLIYSVIDSCTLSCSTLQSAKKNRSYDWRPQRHWYWDFDETSRMRDDGGVG
jgi:hypothetical protein